MRVCIIVEGCYPYSTGGVSSWTHGLIQSFPRVEFVLQTIISSREQSGKFVYELPENVTEVHELYLTDVDWDGKWGRRSRGLNKQEYAALRGLVMGQGIDWDILFKMFQGTGISLDRLLISEHGIYTREREEGLIRAGWVSGVYKNIWIEQFHKMSALAYARADLVTSLYEHARELQIELGCPAEKTMVTPNGILADRLWDLPGKTEEDAGRFNIGAILRVTKIKDVKTMIQAFSFAREREPRLKLWIMGPTDEDEEYAAECREQAEALGLGDDVVFTGRIDIRDYLGRMDVTVLTSISEGQPLTILESYAAHVPVIATDVGNCAGLIYGENDDFGAAGILTHIMNVEEIAQAMVDMARNEPMRQRMAESGYKRAMSGYQIEQMRAVYQKIYQDFAAGMGLEWRE